ncbi:MAG: hypothetical protein FWE78_01960 [Methanimicrococcus sp.]|nr:hypothetical protein [Methanimicrococcus sp.]
MNKSKVPTMNQMNLKKRIPFVIAAVLTVTLLLGFAAPAVAPAPADPVCEIIRGGSVYDQYDDFGDAWANITDGDTIKLLDDISYSNLSISGMDITFDVDEYTLWITTYAISESALEVVNGGKLSLTYVPGGELNVMAGGSCSTSVYLADGAVATVTNAYAYSGSTTVARLYNSSTLYVLGSLDGTDKGIEVSDSSKVYVEGNFNAGEHSIYINDDWTPLSKGDGYYVGSSEPGYIEYTHGTGNYVWLRAICKIMETGEYYNDLADALDEAEDGETIQLLKDIDYKRGIHIDRNIIFDLDIYNLTVTCRGPWETPSGAALEVGGEVGSSVILEGKGIFKVINAYGSGYGVYAYNGANVTVNEVECEGGNFFIDSVPAVEEISVGVRSPGPGPVDNIPFDGAGVRAVGDDTRVWVNGHVYSDGVGVEADDGGFVVVEGTITILPDGVYISVGEEQKASGDYRTPSLIPGYFEYSDGYSFVYVKDSAGGGGNGNGNGFGNASIRDQSSQDAGRQVTDSNNNNNNNNNGQDTETDNNPEDDDTQNAGKSWTWLWIILLLLALVAAVWLYMNRKKIQK